MLLTITTTHRPATDLGYLLHKNPSRAQSVDLAVGKAHVFYPEASEARCTAAVLLEIDPVSLVRGGRMPSPRQYVNDRPYVASSLMSSALLKAFGSAMAGTSRDRPEVAARPIPLEAHIAVLPCRGGEKLLRRLFEPLGYTVGAAPHQLDERFPEWGLSDYFTVDLRATVRLADMLQHLYVLIPTLDDQKHYWIGRDEVDKLMHRGGSWLRDHAERDLIVERYLKGLRTFTSAALEQLTAQEVLDCEEVEDEQESAEDAIERPIGLGAQRVEAVLRAIKAAGAKRVLDLGCGEGRLLRELLADPGVIEIVGMDVSMRVLGRARERLRLDRRPAADRARIKLMHGSLTYRDSRLSGFDAAAVIEVVEHLDPARLSAFELSLFGFARPAMVALTTPNADYNVHFANLPAGRYRHSDHRFEWNRSEFRDWAASVGERFGYSVSIEAIGPEDPSCGSPTQMAVFSR